MDETLETTVQAQPTENDHEAAGAFDDTGTPNDQDQRHGDIAELEAQLIARTESEQELLRRLRQAMVDADPEVDPELVQGSTLAELEASYARAQENAERMRGIILPQGVQRVPAGAPGRVRSIPRTAFEKIREGLASSS
jgi:hypothetical protein